MDDKDFWDWWFKVGIYRADPFAKDLIDLEDLRRLCYAAWKLGQTPIVP
jgi:hypothetical protein